MNCVTCDPEWIYPAISPCLSTVFPVCPSSLAYPLCCSFLADVIPQWSCSPLTIAAEGRRFEFLEYRKVIAISVSWSCLYCLPVLESLFLMSSSVCPVELEDHRFDRVKPEMEITCMKYTALYFNSIQERWYTTFSLSCLILLISWKRFLRSSLVSRSCSINDFICAISPFIFSFLASPESTWSKKSFAIFLSSFNFCSSSLTW